MPDHVLQNENIYQTEGAVGDHGCRPVPIRCPHCRHVGAFAALQDRHFSYQKQCDENVVMGFYASLRHCPNPECLGLVFVIENRDGVLAVNPPELIDFKSDGLPPRCLATLTEAVACHGSGAHRAAAMMIRRLLEEICDENEAEGDNLHQRLQQLRDKVVLPEPLFDVMNELKALGNDAAHVDAREYDEIGPEEAADSIELAKEIVKSLYQLKGLLGRLQARKNSGNQEGDAQ